jgi:hypothetical protein
MAQLMQPIGCGQSRVVSRAWWHPRWLRTRRGRIPGKRAAAARSGSAPFRGQARDLLLVRRVGLHREELLPSGVALSGGRSWRRGRKPQHARRSTGLELVRKPGRSSDRGGVWVGALRLSRLEVGRHAHRRRQTGRPIPWVLGQGSRRPALHGEDRRRHPRPARLERGRGGLAALLRGGFRRALQSHRPHRPQGSGARREGEDDPREWGQDADGRSRRGRHLGPRAARPRWQVASRCQPIPRG